MVHGLTLETLAVEHSRGWLFPVYVSVLVRFCVEMLRVFMGYYVSLGAVMFLFLGRFVATFWYDARCVIALFAYIVSFLMLFLKNIGVFVDFLLFLFGASVQRR